jgi:hypothetical protein
MEDISTKLKARDRLRKRLAAQLTPEQRLEAMAALQAEAWQTLQQNPEALARFWRRNFRQRAARSHLRGTL